MANEAKQVETAELVERARAYWTAYQRYHTECRRQAVETGIKHVDADGWGAAVRAAADEMSVATREFHALLEELFPQPDNKAAWEAYHAKFYGPESVQP